MTTYTFSATVVWDRLGTSVRFAGGIRSVSVTDPATGLIPANLKQGGVAVSWLTADAFGRCDGFTCDVPGVVVDFGAGAEALYANEVPGLVVTFGVTTDTAVATIVGNPASATSVSLSSTYAPVSFVDPMSAPYNAVGDGVTDDTTALQAAITAAQVNRGTVTLRPGHTYLTSTLTLSGVTLLGRGATLKAKASMATNTGVLKPIGDNVRIDGVLIDGNAANQTNVGVYGILDGTASGTLAHLSVVGCTISNTSGAAIRVSSTITDLRVSGNKMTATAGGVLVWVSAGQSSDIKITDNNITPTTPGVGTTGGGISMQGATATPAKQVTISGNHIDSSGQIPIEVFDTTQFAFSNNVITAGNRGISMGRCTNGVISGNSVHNQTAYAIEAGGLNYVTISGNTFVSCLVGIQTTGDCNGVTVVGNTILNGQQGIWLSATTTQTMWLIEGNAIIDPTVRGIEIRATTTDVAIIGNTYTITTTPTLANNPIFIMFYGAVTRATVTGNVVSVAQGGASGSSTGAVWIVAGVTTCAISGNTFVSTALITQSAISLAAISCPGLRVERNRVINFSNGILTSSATNDDVVVIDNVMDSTVTTPYTLKSTHLRRTKRSFENTAAPTVGTWAVGDEAHNSAPAVGSPKGWLCTVAGTPGTWVSTGNL